MKSNNFLKFSKFWIDDMNRCHLTKYYFSYRFRKITLSSPEAGTAREAPSVFDRHAIWEGADISSGRCHEGITFIVRKLKCY